MFDKPITKAIDHPVMAVRDMAAGRAAFERLGFTVTPRGRHLEWGTGNWCIMFENDYLELRGVIDPDAASSSGHSLPARDGLMGIAFSTDDAEATYAELADRGFRPKPVKSLRRNFELPEGTVQPQFSLCFLQERELPGLMSVVFCQHKTPELLRRADWLRHPNGACGVRQVTGAVTDLAGAAEIYRRVFGDGAVRVQPDRVTIQINSGHAIELLASEAANDGWLRGGTSRDETVEGLLSISIDVEELDATEKFLASTGVKFDRPSQRAITVASQEACGVPIQFCEL